MSSAEQQSTFDVLNYDAQYDRDYWIQTGNKSERFNRIKPEIIDDLYNNRPNYEWIKSMALIQLQDNIYEQFKFLDIVNKTHVKTNTPSPCDWKQAEQISHDVFSWSFEDFIKRRQILDCTWVDVLKRQSSADCLQQQKIDTDLRELKKYLDQIFRGLLALEQDGIDLNALIWLPLRNAQLYVEVEKNLQRDNKVLREIENGVRNALAGQKMNHLVNRQQENVLQLEESASNRHVWDPIEFGYSFKWYKSKVGQAQYKMDLMVNKYEIACEEFAKGSHDEIVVGSSVLDTYYSEAEKYKSLINFYQNRYDIELEDITNQCSYARLQIDKLKENERFLKREILRFHVEIEKRLEKEERERQAVEQLRLEEEERLRQLEAELAKKNKKKKGNTPLATPKGKK